MSPVAVERGVMFIYMLPNYEHILSEELSSQSVTVKQRPLLRLSVTKWQGTIKQAPYSPVS